MKYFSQHTNRFFLTLIVCLGFMATSLFAQDEELAPEKPAVEAAKPKPKPGKAAEKPGAETPAAEPAVPSDPAVAALLAATPTTPSECARTAKILVDLNQPALAKQLLKKALDAKFDRPQLAALGRELGSAMFLAFSSNSDLQPQGKQLGDAVLEAMKAELQDPQKIAAAVRQLQDPAAEKRTEALRELQYAGKAAVAALIEVLADPKREAEFKNVRTVLAMMGREATTALIGIMETADPTLKEQAIRVLGEANAVDAKYFLLAPALKETGGSGEETAVATAARLALSRLTGGKLPTRSEATKLLLMAANGYLNRQMSLPDVIQTDEQLWQWDGQLRKCVVVPLMVEDARLAIAARLANDALTLDPRDNDARLVYWTAKLELGAYQKGIDKPFDANHVASLVESNPQQLQTLLEYAISTKHFPAATAATVLLGQIGKAGQLLYPPTGQSILVKALQQPDRRLRMAALQAIVKLKPEKPYPGSSNVTQALAFFAAGTGTRRALVAGPNLNKIPKLVSGLSAAGFTVDVANTGKEVLQKLLRSPDYEIAMIDAGISQPPVELLLQQIRRDDRSADVRVGIIARADFFDKAEHVAGSDPLTVDFPRPNDDDAVRWEVEQLAAIKPRDLVRPEERLREAGEALELMAELSRTSPKLYDIRRLQDVLLAALKTSSLAPKAVAVLANINSPEAQRALVAVASRETSPIELRQAVVEAFRANVQAYGILLTTDEIRRQYDLYNQSEKADKASQKVFGLILDCLEASKK
jgi:hypothetical protein